MKIPFDINPIHCVGIGGIGMSGIAEVLHNLGFRVQGSDIANSFNVRRLVGLGIPVAIGHDADNLGAARVVVVSSAIAEDNPEIQAARARGLPVAPRADMLAELMRFRWSVAVAGSHGKTTVTSLIAAVLDIAGYDPTVINGGIVNAWGGATRMGGARPDGGQWMVVEADESDGGFVRLPLTAAVVTSIDPEHLDHYGDFSSLCAAFEAFVTNTPFYGFVVMCLDHPGVQSVMGRITGRRVITYGTNLQADVRARDAHVVDGKMLFVAERRTAGDNRHATLGSVALPLLGDYNVRNALAAIAVGMEIGAPWSAVCQALESFSGVRRRFSLVGAWNGVRIYDDYAHHPVEIAAVLEAARMICGGRLVAVVQPHRYSRLAGLFDDFCACFNSADTVAVAPVYGAGEPPRAGVDHDALVRGLRDHGHRAVEAVADPDALAELLAVTLSPDDVVVCLGAGSITAWAHGLAEKLAARAQRPGAGAPGTGRAPVRGMAS